MSKLARKSKAKVEKANVHDGHRERMRQRFLTTKEEGFQPHELLEMLLYYTIPRRNTNELAHEILNKFNNDFAELMDASPEMLAENGINESTIVLLKLIPAFMRVYFSNINEEKVFDNIDDLKELFAHYFVGLDHEVIYLACFHNNFTLAKIDKVFEGSISDVNADIRKIVDILVRANCSIVVLAHNHPHGSATPSSNDIAFTQNLNRSLEGINVILADHLIYGRYGVVSLRESFDNIFFDSYGR